MKELKFKQKRKVVRDYIKERFQNQYYGDFKPTEWYSKSNHELESTIDDMNGFTEEDINLLKISLDIELVCEKTGDVYSPHEDLFINELIKDHEWGLIYNELNEKVKDMVLDKLDSENLEDVVDHLQQLITYENTKFSLMEILTSRVGLKEEITFKSK